MAFIIAEWGHNVDQAKRIAVEHAAVAFQSKLQIMPARSGIEANQGARNRNAAPHFKPQAAIDYPSHPPVKIEGPRRLAQQFASEFEAACVIMFVFEE